MSLMLDGVGRGSKGPPTQKVPLDPKSAPTQKVPLDPKSPLSKKKIKKSPRYIFPGDLSAFLL
jgi:hypothetical protein